jgi:ankyrin repeat protein
MENQFEQNIGQDLICPITNELLDDPVCCPACQKAFSRIPLATWFQSSPSQKCPTCNAELPDFNAMTAPKNVIIAGLVETFKNKDSPKQGEPKKHLWSASLSPLIDPSGHTLPLAEMKISIEESLFPTKPTLVLIILDVSGSMSGTGERQCREALNHIVSTTFSNSFVKLVLVTYQSFAKIIELTGTLENMKASIAGIRAGGGNNEEAAFKLAGDILKKYKYSDVGDVSDDFSVSSVSILFLTDGQACRDRKELIVILQEVLQESWVEPWGGPLCIHTIGFTGACDTAFLEDVRKQGSVEGTYRYADTTDTDDALCLKLQSLFDSISESSRVGVNLNISPLQFKIGDKLVSQLDVQFPIKKDRRGTYTQWVKYEPKNEDEPLGNLVVNSQLDKDVVVPIVLTKATARNKQRLLDKWISTIVDELAVELLELNNSKANYGVNTFDLHCALIQQRVEAVTARTANEASLKRLEFIGQQVESLRSGSSVNINRLGDMRFGSQFAAVIPVNKPVVAPAVAAILEPELVKKIADAPAWKEVSVNYSRNSVGKGRNALQESIMDNIWNKVTPDTARLLAAATIADILHTDDDGNNTLHLAAFCGQVETTKIIIEKFKGLGLDLEAVNAKQETALTLAIKKRGFHRTVQLLLDFGAVIPGGRSKALQEFAINCGYSITAQIISNVGETGTDVNEAMTIDYVRFMYKRAMDKGSEINVVNYLKVALSKCMPDLIKELVEKHGAEITVEMFLAYCIPPKADDPETEKYIELAKYFLDRKPEMVTMADINDEDCLFRASERGSNPHVRLFLERGAIVDRPNKMGNTALWIACAKRYPCIVDVLISAGADVNWANFKGNPPMYNLVQKGPKKMVETLLANGAHVDHINENGDTLLLLCCRNGQHEILELLLNYADPEFVNFKAHIDGFNCIFSSAEANRPDCIQVLKNYGIDLNQKTDPDNKILATATPLAIASYYNKFEAAKKLIELGANVNERDANGSTALHIAVIQGHSNIIRLLRNSGADVTIKDNMGNVPAVYCRNRLEIRKLLVNPLLDVLMNLAKGMFSKGEEVAACKILMKYTGVIGCLSTKDSVDILDGKGVTALSQAVIHSNFQVAQVLIQLGADPNVPNSWGLTAHIFGRWINNPRMVSLLGEDVADPAFMKMALDRLRTATNSGIVNKQVLFLGSKPLKVQQEVSSGINVRMEEFINALFVANPEAVSKIPKIDNGGKISVVSYFEQKEFNELKDMSLMWGAKVFCTNLIASGGTFLEPREVMALCMFTNNHIVPKVLNDAIMREHYENATINDYIGTLVTALNKMDPFVGEVFCGANKVYRQLFTVGKEVCWSSFLSASALWRVAIEHVPEFDGKKKTGTVFIIHSKTGRYVGSHSQYNFDSEVLFKPFTKFKVTNWYHGGATYVLAQSNIRKSTYGVKDDEVDQLTNGDKALVIELEEL